MSDGRTRGDGSPTARAGERGAKPRRAETPMREPREKATVWLFNGRPTGARDLGGKRAYRSIGYLQQDVAKHKACGSNFNPAFAPLVG